MDISITKIVFVEVLLYWIVYCTGVPVIVSTSAMSALTSCGEAVIKCYEAQLQGKYIPCML